MDKLILKKDGTLMMNGTEFKRVSEVDIKNINPYNAITVVLTIDVDEVDIDFKVR